VKDFLSTSSDAWKLPPVIRYKETKEIIEIEEGEEEEEEEEEEEGIVDGEEKVLIDSNVHESSTDTDPVPQEPLSVCAIDCEMCYTKAGLELTRVCIVPLSALPLFFIPCSSFSIIYNLSLLLYVPLSALSSLITEKNLVCKSSSLPMS
jgi:hypothetical protein